MSKFTPNSKERPGSNDVHVGVFHVPDIRRVSDGKSATAADAVGATRPKDSHFSLHPQVRQSLKLDQIEQASIDDRVRLRMSELETEIRAKGHAEGYTAGLAQGRAEAYEAVRVEATEELSRFRVLVKSFDTAKAEIFAQNERFILDLALQIAHRLAKRTIAQDTEFLKRVILEIIEKAGLKGLVKIRVNPLDLEMVKTFVPTLAAAIPDFKNVDFVPDPAIEAGACTVQSEWGEIHTSLSSQFERIYESLVGSGTGQAS